MVTAMSATTDVREHSPYQRDADAVEADWRAVRTELTVVPGDTMEASRLRAEAGRLRDEHQRLVNEALRHGRTVRPLSPR